MLRIERMCETALANSFELDVAYADGWRKVDTTPEALVTAPKHFMQGDRTVPSSGTHHSNPRIVWL